MDSGTATLLAAVVAAVASLATLVLSTLTSRAAEFRASFRQSLDPHIADLGEAIHETIAISKMLIRAQGDESTGNWRLRGKRAQGQLKSLRGQMRYSLWGVDEGLRVLTRVPDWLDHLRTFPESSEKLFARATGLSEYVDLVIYRAYRRGRPPNFLERMRVRYLAWRLRSTHSSIMAVDRAERR